ncbi:MAG: type IV toxin-antitoxin system AbiEi family antitoxin [Alphaproteobacteria bacterium]|nr:type IV toxin-antitoxin system AbiEi family antitoxin [Alphaproteobacteria bacterium]
MSMFHKYIKDLRKNGKRSFTIQQLITELKTAHAATLVGLHRLKQEGDIISPARGFYVIVPPEYQRQGSIPPEELVVLLMEYLNQPYYVSLLSAAQHYGATHQRPNSFQVVCNRRIQHPLEFGSVSIDAVYKQDLKSLPINQLFTPVGYLNIASPELLVFDLFYYSKRSGGLNHIATLLSELIASIDIPRVIELAKLLDEKAWVQRLGYTLDHIETEDEDKKVMITEKLLEYLSNKMKLYVPMEPGIDRKGYPRNKKWKIIENVKIESDV